MIGLPTLLRTACACAAVTVLASCAGPDAPPGPRTFATPDDAVRALAAAVERGDLDEVRAIFGPASQDLLDTSDPPTARRNRQVFTAAMAEGWRLAEVAGGKELVIGHEGWPFPVPLVAGARGWQFDTEAGREEVIARRIGRNELAAIRISRAYVTAQRLYAQRGHDGKPAGLYASRVRSDPGRENGLYWPAAHGRRRSPIGELIADAADRPQGLAARRTPAPLHGYYFRILTAQGPHAAGGARSYLEGGEMAGGFALVAWPARYDVTGVMTFIVNQEGIVHEKDFGPGGDIAAQRLAAYDPDPSWSVVP